MKGKVTVHNKKHEPMGRTDVYVGRGSPWGNNFATKPSSFDVVKVATVAESIERCEGDLINRLYLDPRLRALMDDLARRHQGGEDLRLFCFCAPGPCHGDVMKRIIETWPTVEDHGAFLGMDGIEI